MLSAPGLGEQVCNITLLVLLPDEELAAIASARQLCAWRELRLSGFCRVQRLRTLSAVGSGSFTHGACISESQAHPPK